MQKGFVFIIVFFSVVSARATEGMWLPSHIHKNIDDMQQMGLKLSAEDLYSEDGTSLNDAIVRFGRGCTGAFISSQGLLITNHHCGYGQIQRHSSVDNDYLTHGFWASRMEEELENPGLTVTMLVRMQDVTRDVLQAVDENLPEKEFQAEVAALSRALAREASENGTYQARVEPFYFGNEYYLFVYQTFRDVRMVGAPPSSIGKFGGDTDNWMWPRHRGDFMLYRVYADENNQPADFSPDNVPYTPEHFFPVAQNGGQKEDFTMVYGFPGRTRQYLTSDAVEFIIRRENPAGIKIRTRILDIYEESMAASDTVRIQYATRHARVSNAWKRWGGEIRGLERLNALQVKREQEALFADWVDENPEVASAYGELMRAFEDTYRNYHPYRYAFRLYLEAARSVELVRFAQQFARLAMFSKQDEPDMEAVENEIMRLKEQTEAFFKDYHAPTDQKLLGELTLMYIQMSDRGFLPPVLQDVKDRYGYDTQRFAERVFRRSLLTTKEDALGFLDNYRLRHHRRLEKDPAYDYAMGLLEFLSVEVQTPMQQLQNQLDSLYRVYTYALKQKRPEHHFFPDANGTLRITYGKIEGSYPRDGLCFKHYTTTDGILEKFAEQSNPDYYINERLETLLANRAFGEYEREGQLNVNFIASNHTTGGNSGSPVLDRNGNFIGINFDRSWESTMSDIMFDPEQCRNISVNSAYILWVIDKYARMGYLLDEMDIVVPGKTLPTD